MSSATRYTVLVPISRVHGSMSVGSRRSPTGLCCGLRSSEWRRVPVVSPLGGERFPQLCGRWRTGETGVGAVDAAGQTERSAGVGKWIFTIDHHRR